MVAVAERALIDVLAHGASPVMVARGVSVCFGTRLIRRFALAFHSAKSLPLCNRCNWSRRTNSCSVFVPIFFIPPCNLDLCVNFATCTKSSGALYSETTTNSRCCLHHAQKLAWSKLPVMYCAVSWYGGSQYITLFGCISTWS